MKFNLKNIIFLFFLVIVSCKPDYSEKVDLSSPLFEIIPISQSNITFKNIISESAINNMLTNDNIYAGGGVAVGDINNDGLQDIYFVSNQNKHALYLNKGDFQFEDITDKAGIKKVEGWGTGVVMEDVNQDGHLDIYVSRGGKMVTDPEMRRNLLYVNNGDATFTERAKSYGLDDPGVTTQSVFFDYDLDGDLDAYVMNVPSKTLNIPIADLRDQRLNPRDWLNSDHFYRNEGGNKFVEVSKEVGIANWGSGLGISIADINKDGFPDIYISNDFATDNFFFINTGTGKFIERAKLFLKHVSYFAMGVDVGDIDNNGHLDFFEVEMLPKERKRAVMNMQPMDRALFQDLMEKQMTPQYMRNSLQLNNGYGRFSEVAQLAGVPKTDWSWGTLLIDMDDDGHKDIFVTNGIIRDMKDRDFARTGNKLANQSDGKLSLEQHLKIAPSTRVPNVAYRNGGNLKFENTSTKWGLDFKGFSNGVSYGDLDNDGDLDLIINNLEDSPIIYKNTSTQRSKNYINFKFKGPKGNLNGIGTKVTIFTDKGLQYSENYTVRGFQSSSENLMHFGLGKTEKIDSIQIIWPSNKQQTIRTQTNVNQLITLDHKNSNELYQQPVINPKYLSGSSRKNKINFVHSDPYFDDYNREILIPHKMSQLGPGLATGDINGDGFKDFYIGGGHQQAGALFTTTSDGTFQKIAESVFEPDSKFEDIGACFFDIDNDKDLDLYVVSGSNEFDKKSGLYQDRIYINQGNGKFVKNKTSLPTITSSGSCATAADFDGDGDQDLFVGGRQEPGKYPLAGQSILFKNEGGKLVDVTSKISDLQEVGMVTSAVWTDYDKDNDPDLMLTGEWMGIKLYNNDNGNFKDVSSEVGLDGTNGWWFSINPCDFDKDGDQDFIVGNIGLNHKFKASKDKPLQVFCNDFDNSGNLDIVLAFDQKDKLYPVRGRDCSSEQMPFITDKFPTFASFGDAGVNDIFDKEKLEASTHKKAELFASILLINDGGTFRIKELPVEAQISAITGAVPYDFNNDGHEDILAAGNMYQTEAETSRADASIGIMLHGDGKGNYTDVPLWDSGMYCPGDAKDMELITLKNGKPLFIIANNSGKIQTYSLKD